MDRNAAGNRVMIKRCEDYDRNRIMDIVQEGMTELNYRPSGKIFVKPNVVFSRRTGEQTEATYTHTSVVGGSLLALSRPTGVRRLDLGESSGIGFPTRMCFKYAGYYDEIRQVRKKTQVPVGIFCIEERRRDRVFIGGQIHESLRIPRKMAWADSKVYLPKLKCHCISTITGAVKLNIGICSPDERAIRHDFLLDDKIVDLLAVGSPDFIVMDAVDVGVGNEVTPTPRRLGLIIMGTNPMAVDLVGARLLGYGLEDVAHLKAAAERGYAPCRLEDVEMTGDLKSIDDLDQAARRIQPYDDEFHRWQDIEKELARLESPIRFFWGYSKPADKSKCLTGCVLATKMFLGFLEAYAGADAFKKTRPVVLVIGEVEEPIDAAGHEVFLIGSCTRANVINAKKIVKIDRCFTTALDLAQVIRGRLGIRTPITDPREVLPLVYYMLIAGGMKLLSRRYIEDIGHFIRSGLLKRI